jgi:hypothetical protein
MKSPSAKKAPRGSAGGPQGLTSGDNNKDSTFSAQSQASSDLRRAELMEKAAAILAQSIFASRFTSPDVSTLESALHVLLLDAADFHRYKASRPRRSVPILFERAA